MSYFCIFNKKGWLLKEEGIAPTYLNSVISSIDPSTLSGSRTVRDDKVEYEIRGPIVYLSIGGRKSLRDRIQDELTREDQASNECGNNDKVNDSNSKANLSSNTDLNKNTKCTNKETKPTNKNDNTSYLDY